MTLDDDKPKALVRAGETDSIYGMPRGGLGTDRPCLIRIDIRRQFHNQCIQIFDHNLSFMEGLFRLLKLLPCGMHFF